MRQRHDNFNGGITFRKGKFYAQFTNPISKEHINLGGEDTEEKARVKYSEYQINFYLEHDYLLPKGISVRENLNKFTACIFAKGKKIHLGTFLTVQEAEAHRKQVIMNMF